MQYLTRLQFLTNQRVRLQYLTNHNAFTTGKSAGANKKNFVPAPRNFPGINTRTFILVVHSARPNVKERCRPQMQPCGRLTTASPLWHREPLSKKTSNSWSFGRRMALVSSSSSMMTWKTPAVVPESSAVQFNSCAERVNQRPEGVHPLAVFCKNLYLMSQCNKWIYHILFFILWWAWQKVF